MKGMGRETKTQYILSTTKATDPNICRNANLQIMALLS